MLLSCLTSITEWLLPSMPHEWLSAFSTCRLYFTLLLAHRSICLQMGDWRCASTGHTWNFQYMAAFCRNTLAKMQPPLFKLLPTSAGGPCFRQSLVVHGYNL